MDRKLFLLTSSTVRFDSSSCNEASDGPMKINNGNRSKSAYHRIIDRPQRVVAHIEMHEITPVAREAVVTSTQLDQRHEIRDAIVNAEFHESRSMQFQMLHEFDWQILELQRDQMGKIVQFDVLVDGIDVGIANSQVPNELTIELELINSVERFPVHGDWKSGEYLTALVVV